MSQPTSLPRQPHPHSYVGAFLSYLIPGLGQMYQGRIGKGLMFMVCLLGMFFYGEYLGDWQNVYLPRMFDPRPPDNPIAKQLPSAGRDLLQRWHFGGQFWIGIAAWPAIWQYMSIPDPRDIHDEEARRNEIRKREEELRKKEDDTNEYLMVRDKTPDVAWVYTVVAGILNILVIYDAFAGPAHASEEEPAK